MNETTKSRYDEALSKRNVTIFTVFLGALIISSTVIFGANVIWLLLAAIVSSLFVEVNFAYFRKRQFDRSWIIVPMIVTLLLPVTVPIWLPIVAAGFGTFFGKAIFGGSGKNIFNPALVGILFVTISFPVEMNTTWINPLNDEIGTTTPLITLNTTGSLGESTFSDLLLGTTPGLLGETFRLGILLLGLALILFKVIDWRIPLSFIVSFLVLMGIGYLIMPDTFVNPIFALFTGAVLFASFFVITDPVTAPISGTGRMIYGFGIALFTIIIRIFATFPEGIVFAVIIMNAIAPLIDSSLEKEEAEEATS
ncbi:MAG: RnfABCDGE type electron transport complex subunit D [Candidatus Izemoplasmataceae bacterium]